ncbi:DUF6531 domain-containing protein, partial [Lachnospiraceae bacterium OttesenSCG-928-D06]|nr:DUF6531 domain-containing protein [Lachnospiraceae bacterium OttesenSCG-928-D06]
MKLNLKLNLNDNGSITSSWTPIEGAVRYHLYMHTPGYTYMYFNEANLTTTSYTSMANLTDNLQYQVTLAAYNSSNICIDSEGGKVLILLGFYDDKPLGIPDNIKASSTTNSVNIRFAKVNRATSYDILFDGTVHNVKEISKTFTGLASKKSYTYAIRARNEKMVGEYSKTETITTLANALTIPTGISAVSTDNSVTIKWNVVSVATGYNISFNGTTYSTTDTSKTISGLSANKGYTYAVQAKNADGISSYSTFAVVTTAPSAPTAITVKTNQDSAVLEWGAVTGASGYNLLFDGNVFNVPLTSRMITGLSANTDYTYSVSSKNSDGISSYGNTKIAKTAPNPPSNLNAEATVDTVKISWESSNGATGYELLFNEIVYNVTGNNKTITGLSANTRYTYSVASKNSGGSSTHTTSRLVTTLSNKPAIPTNVIATATENTVKISFTGVSGASSYDILFNGMVHNVTSPFITINGLEANTSYEYAVCAKNAGGSSNYSSTQMVWTTPKAPTVPKAITNEKSITINWAEVAGATSYDILFNGIVYNVIGINKIFTGLQANTSYTYAIRSNGVGGSSGYGRTITIMTAPSQPAAPTTSVTSSEVTLIWNSVSGATSYDILFDGVTYRVNGTSKTISGLLENTNYTYSICSNNADGSSTYSVVKTVTTLPNRPSVPTNVAATATINTVAVSWLAVTGAISYDILFNGNVYNVQGTNRTFTGLTPGTNYTFQVCAKNAGGNSDYSIVKTIQTLVPIPSVPTGVIATATHESITVTWNEVSGATSYGIKVKEKLYIATGTSITISGLIAQQSYNYCVCARNAGGASAYSVLRTISTNRKPPAIPTGIKATATKNTVTISFTAATGATQYYILFNGVRYGTTTTSRTFSNLVPGMTYTYCVSSSCEGSVSKYSPERTIKTIPNAPSTLIDMSASATSDSVFIRFGTVLTATSYDILFNGTQYYIDVSTEFEEDEILKVFKDLTENTEYTYRIRANNEGGSSAYSDIQAVRTKPGYPKNIKTTATTNAIRISFDPVNGAESYDIDFDGNIYNVMHNKNRRNISFLAALPEEQSASTFATPKEQVVTKRFAGLAPNTEHTLCVRANTQLASSEYSPKENVRTKKNKSSKMPNVKNNSKYLDGKLSHTGLDPVNALTGAFIWSYTFLEDFGKDSLHFTAMYDSGRDEYHKALGYKWTYSLNYLLYMDNEYAYFSTPYDEVVPFLIDDNQTRFQLAEGITSNYSMEKQENGFYCIQDLDGTKYLFDENLHLNEIIENGLTSYQFTVNSEGQIAAITGRHGRSLTLTYKNDHIETVSDIMENIVRFTYEGNYLVAVTNKEGNSITFSYDLDGNLLEITDFSGEIYLTNTYDEQDRVIGQNTAGKGYASVRYDEENKITFFVDEMGCETAYYYESNLQVTCISVGGITVQKRYNEQGQLIRQLDGVSNSTWMEYDDCGRLNKIIHPDQTTESVEYNQRNYPVKVINRDGTEVLYSYDTRNNLIALKNEKGNTCYYTYDNQDNVTSLTDKSGNTWTYVYDSNNHLKEAVDPKGFCYKYWHDEIGRLLSYVSPSGRETRYQYSVSGELLRITDATGTVMFEYDANGNQTSITDQKGNKQRMEYNEMGLVSLVTDFLGNEYKYVYNDRGDLIQEIDPLGYCKVYTYDPAGNVETVTDKNGNTKMRTLNAAGQVTQVKTASGSKIKYSYDTMGRVKTITDPLENQTNYTYDSMGRIASVTNALNHSIHYTYDQTGNLQTKTDENGMVTRYTYNAEDKVVSISTDAGTIRFDYDSLGRVISIEDVDGYKEETQYDGDGNVIEFLSKENYKTEYVYDNSGRLKEETDPYGGKTLYEYDQKGNCIKITDAAGNESIYEYDSMGNMLKFKNPLGNETLYSYNQRGDLVSVTDARGGVFSFEYDGNGNPVKEINPLGGVTLYTYDCFDHVVEKKDDDGNKWTYTYDENGNQTSYTDANQNKWMQEYDEINRLIRIADQNGYDVALKYTKSGEIEKVIDQEGAVTSYFYDTMGRMIQMSDALGNSLYLQYDNKGRITEKTDENGNTTQYEYSPAGNLVCIREPEGNST